MISTNTNKKILQVKSEAQIESLLQKFSLKKTELRVSILHLFLSEERSFSQAEIIDHLTKKNKSIDRISIYRNLKQLKTIGVIHEVENNKYVCCSHDCEQHAHVLLYCSACNKHLEVKNHKQLETLFKAINNLNFLTTEQTLFLKGQCETCAHS